MNPTERAKELSGSLLLNILVGQQQQQQQQQMQYADGIPAISQRNREKVMDKEGTRKRES